MTWKSAGRFSAHTLSMSLRAGCMAHLIQEYVYEFRETRGESMLPTLDNRKEYVHELKKYRLGRDVEMGDCIVAAKPTDPLLRVCKRVTGMPGDIVLVDPSSSSELTNTPAEVVAHDGFNKYIEVPKGHVWCTGDNLGFSLDSRSYSVLPMGLITGKITMANTRNKGWASKQITNNFIDEV